MNNKMAKGVQRHLSLRGNEHISAAMSVAAIVLHDEQPFIGRFRVG